MSDLAIPPPPDPPPDLAKLAHVLRHRELWPPGFVWNYAYHHQCAVALAVRFWFVRKTDYTHDVLDQLDWMKREFGLSAADLHLLYKRVRRRRPWWRAFMTSSPHDTSPEDVARAIERHLAGHHRRSR